MLEKGTGASKQEFVDSLMRKKDSNNECILRTMSGDYYGRIVSVGFDKVTIVQDGENKTIDVDYILEVE